LSSFNQLTWLSRCT